ncbi:response regulator transcription factor [Salipiger sp. P9]|uniref:response regulator transcription factor n=1 Tax=Salipiger pentaromativorans TaxID=2943193 RepID=UPI002157E444|nr:response regulator transcription factor [Salipiger pentaromativorans]MCR8549171.1 response regulator transcription factor [Salipiger pentaromativorans]
MRILIVEDISETRRWLAEIAAEVFPDAQIDTADTLRRARMLLPNAPDLALIDLGLPDGSGLDLLRQLRDAQSPTVCVVTTVMGDDASVVGALSAGAQGYLLKENPATLLIHQLRQIHMGLPALSPSIARRIMEHFSLTGPNATAGQDLTERETEVLALIARGLRNSEVGRELGLANTTVASYIKSIYRKLGISSRAEASWHATRMGLNSGGQGPHSR